MQDNSTPYEISHRINVGYGYTNPQKGAPEVPLTSPFRRRTLRPLGTPDWCLLIGLEGRYIIYPDSNHPFSLHPSSAVLFPPHTSQDYTLHHDYAQGKFFWAHFFPEISMKPFLNWPKPTMVLNWDHDATLNEAILDACRRCIVFFNSNYAQRRSLSLLKIEEVLRLIHQVHPDHKSRHLDDRVAHALQYVSKEIHSKLSAKIIAGKVGLSTSRFTSIFIQNMQCGIMEYIEKQRLSMARSMLTNNKIPITVIAGECGFSSVSYFTKRFRRSYSMSPSEYRRSHNQ